MAITKGKGKRDPFLSLPLDQQCVHLGIGFELISMQRTLAGWAYGEEGGGKPEPAALEFFKEQGFNGNCCEGAAPLMLMKCAALNFLSKVNIFSSRSDARLRYFEAQCVIYQHHAKDIVAEIQGATEADICRHFAEIRSEANYLALYPEINIDGLLALWNAAGSKKWARIAEAFIEAPHNYRAGWPDISMARGDQLRFVEVKTKDKLHLSQKQTISGLLLPLGLSVSVVKLAG